MKVRGKIDVGIVHILLKKRSPRPFKRSGSSQPKGGLTDGPRPAIKQYMNMLKTSEDQALGTEQG